MKVKSRSLHWMLSVAAICAVSSAAQASIETASSSGYGLNVQIAALGLGVNAGPLPTGVSGTAPNPYALSNSVLNVNVSTNIPLVVSGTVRANAVFGSANSDVNGLPGDRFASASGGVVGAQIGAVTLPLIGGGITLLGLNGTLSSTASISGDTGSLQALGGTTIESLGLTIGGTVVDLSAFVGVSVAPNTTIDLSALGILDASLILNEQIIAPDQTSIEVNALRLSLNTIAVEGEVILGHSQVDVSTSVVPEPSMFVIFSVGCLGFVALRRR